MKWEQAFNLTLPVVIRRCLREDLPTLEWFGLFAPHRELIQNVFAEQDRGEALMLVAEVNGVAAGQVWIDFLHGRTVGTGILWAMRVFPCLQRRGLGGRLLAGAEDVLHFKGFTRAEVAVEPENAAAQAFYTRHGYQRVTEAVTSVFRDPVMRPHDQFILHKEITEGSRRIPQHGLFPQEAHG